MTDKLATRLLLGSSVIDRMQQEIDDIIALLIGYLNSGRLVWESKEDGFIAGELRFPMIAEGMEWRVGRLGHNHDFRLYFDLDIIDAGRRRCIYHSMNYSRPVPESKQRVRNALEYLAEALGNRYPEMFHEWQPLLKAAAEI